MRWNALRRILTLLIMLAGARAQALTLTPSAPSVQEGQAITMTSDVAANWSLAPGSVGTLTASTDGRSAVYTAPRSIIPQNALAGCPVMPNDSVFNTRIDRLPLESHSATWINTMAAHNATLAAFDTSWGTSIGDHTTPMQNMTFAYTTTSDGAWMMPQGALLKRENGNYKTGVDSSDHHIMAVNHESCQFYEIYNNDPFSPYDCGRSVQCTAQSGWQFNGAGYALPWSHGSTDAGGLPLAPLTLHLDEVKAGAVHHAMRFVAGCGLIQGRNPPYWPATGSNGFGGTDTPPYGARFRLKAGFNIAGVCGTGLASTQACTAILTGLQQYGMMLADIGACGSGGTFASPVIAVDTDLNEDPGARAALSQIAGKIAIGNFDIVDESGLMVTPASGEVNPANGFVTPSPYAVVKAVDKANAQNTLSVPIGLQGVAIGLLSPVMTIMAGTPAFQVHYWVNGTANHSANWSLVSGVGTVTSAGAYTPPGSVSAPASAVLKAVAAADPNAVTFLYVTVIPAGVNPSGGIRIDSAGHAPVADGNGNTWLPDVGWEAGDPNPRPPDPPWPTSNPENIIYRSVVYTAGGDYVYNFVVPNGNYKVRFMFAKDFNEGWGGTLSGCVVDPDHYAPIDLETQGQIQIANYSWPAAVNFQCAVPVDVYAPAQVTNNMLEAAVRPILPRTGTSHPASYITGFEVIPDTAPPHITIDPSTAAVAFNGSLQLRAVGWYMSNAVNWRLVKGPGSINASGLYLPPGTPISGSVPVTVEAISQVDSSKTATMTFSLVLGAMSLTPNTATVVHGTDAAFSALINGQAYTHVRWTLSPALGSISVSGLYSAPNTLAQDATVTLTATSLDDPSVSATATLHLRSATPTIFVDAGDLWYSVTDENGGVWPTDYGFTGGLHNDNTSSPIQGASAQMQPVYQSAHYCYAGQSFTYQFPLPDGQYSVTLKFADYSYATPPKPPYLEDVQINGATVLSAFNPDAGGVTHTAVDRTFNATVTDKVMTLKFIGDSQGGGALINGIEIAPVGSDALGTRTSAGASLAPTVFPNPWRSDKGFAKQILFKPLPSGARVEVFTVSGRKVKEFSVDSQGQGRWDLTNNTGREVGSGLYLYLVNASDGRTARGKLAIVH